MYEVLKTLNARIQGLLYNTDLTTHIIVSSARILALVSTF